MDPLLNPIASMVEVFACQWVIAAEESSSNATADAMKHTDLAIRGNLFSRTSGHETFSPAHTIRIVGELPCGEVAYNMAAAIPNITQT